MSRYALGASFLRPLELRLHARLGLACVMSSLVSACGGGGADANSLDSPDLPPVTDPAPIIASLQDWRLVWRDEFDQDGLPDAAKWNYDTYRNQVGWHNAELQYYAARRLENSRVADGKLAITARQEQLTSAADWGRQNYTSTRLVTRGKAEWTYGHFEIRAKLPCALGTWPAIWMLGSHTLPTEPNWPQDGEIDIMEQRGTSAAEKQKVLGTMHFADAFGGAGPTAERALPNACTDFNVYHMTWTREQIEIGVNGVVFNTYRKPANATLQNWPFDAPQYLLLNVAVGGTLGGGTIGSLPASMEVDYVRVWQQ